jgi:hypothetical protein
MRCYDINFVDDHICKTDPSQKVLDSWVRIKKDAAEALKPSHNSDYAAALKVVGEFCIEHSSSEQCIDFRGWLLQRLNETRSHSA